MTKITRKKFLQMFLWLLVIPVAELINILVRKKKNELSEKVYLPVNLPNGITLKNDLIINKSIYGLKVLSSKCTHLGCLIKTKTEDRLICPCHGSEYTFTGEVLKGPSAKSLKELEVNLDKKTGEHFVYVTR